MVAVQLGANLVLGVLPQDAQGPLDVRGQHQPPRPGPGVGDGQEPELERRAIRHAHKLSCADVYDLEKAPVTPVGPACAICPRIDCAYRATPPAGRMLAVDRTRKTISPFPFVAG